MLNGILTAFALGLQQDHNPRQVSITRQATDETSPSRPVTAETDASVRQILAEQIAGAQSDLEHGIDHLRRSGQDGDARLAESQLTVLSRLRRQLDHASPAALAALRAQVSSLVSATQLSLSPASSGDARREAIQQVADAAHQQVQDFVHDFYERKIFDPYLRFASPEDEEAYRKRETERLVEIKKAESEGTAQGELRALKISKAQLDDAGAHGADRSPAFQSMRDGIAADTARLETTVKNDVAPSVDPIAAIKSSALVDPALIASLRQTGAKLTADRDHLTVPDARQSAGTRTIS